MPLAGISTHLGTDDDRTHTRLVAIGTHHNQSLPASLSRNEHITRRIVLYSTPAHRVVDRQQQITFCHLTAIIRSHRPEHTTDAKGSFTTSHHGRTKYRMETGKYDIHGRGLTRFGLGSQGRRHRLYVCMESWRNGRLGRAFYELFILFYTKTREGTVESQSDRQWGVCCFGSLIDY